jgi:hypothetical protein
MLVVQIALLNDALFSECVPVLLLAKKLQAASLLDASHAFTYDVPAREHQHLQCKHEN